MKAFIYSLATAGVIVACASSSTPPPATKTCADLNKCCDTLSDPSKSACTAAVGGKSDGACASFYEKNCVVDAAPPPCVTMGGSCDPTGQTSIPQCCNPLGCYNNSVCVDPNAPCKKAMEDCSSGPCCMGLLCTSHPPDKSRACE